jgi:uncharacterized protein YegP (UPF0339 family)
MGRLMTDQARIYRGGDGLWYWHIKAGNGEVIAQGEGYERVGDARDVLEQHFPDAPIVEDDQ